MFLISIPLILNIITCTLAEKFEVQLLANTYENSIFSNYGLMPVYQQSSDFDGLVFLLGNEQPLFTYDNSTQFLSYSYNKTTYYVNVMNDYLVGFTNTSTANSTTAVSYNKFLMNVDGSLWVTQINNNFGYNLFYTFPNQPQNFNAKSYFSPYLLETKTQPINTQEFTIIYQRVDNSTAPIIGSNDIAIGDIGAVALNLTLAGNATTPNSTSTIPPLTATTLGIQTSASSSTFKSSALSTSSVSITALVVASLVAPLIVMM